MNKKELEQFIPTFRTGALSMKEYYKLSKQERDQYVLDLFELPKEQLGQVDKHLMKFHNLEINQYHFFSIED
jgi:hypothetical protein